MSKLWRCYNPNCTEHPAGVPGYDFESDEPECPKCGASHRIPRVANLITALVVVHLDPPSKWPDIGLGEWACKPGVKAGAGMRTGDPTSVNCKACKATQVWRDEMEKMGAAVPRRHDREIEIDLEKQEVRERKG